MPASLGAGCGHRCVCVACSTSKWEPGRGSVEVTSVSTLDSSREANSLPILFQGSLRLHVVLLISSPFLILLPAPLKVRSPKAKNLMHHPCLITSDHVRACCLLFRDRLWLNAWLLLRRNLRISVCCIFTVFRTRTSPFGSTPYCP